MAVEKTFGGLIFGTAGSASVTVTDVVTPSVTGSENGVAVAAGNPNRLRVSGASAGTAGTPATVTVEVQDAYGNDTPIGTIHLSSSDPNATLPADYTFTGGDAGVHGFAASVVLKTSGTQSVTAVDLGNSAIRGSQSGIVTLPAAASALRGELRSERHRRIAFERQRAGARWVWQHGDVLCWDGACQQQ